jgi:hypothetical protein
LTTIHIAAIGSIGQHATVYGIPDPRMRDHQYELFTKLGAIIERYFQDCRAAGTYPQLWVSSTAAAHHLDILADRLRYNSQNQQVRRLGELLSYYAERYPLAGQQVLIPATSALSQHWATGQQVGEDEHLGALLTWLTPPRKGNVLAAVAQAECTPMGIKTDPEFDREVLAPLVRAYNVAKREGASRRMLESKATLIQAKLQPIVLTIYRATQRAIAFLCHSGLPPLPDLAALSRREGEEFAAFMLARDHGYPLPLRDSPKLATFKLSAREDAIKNMEAAIRRSDCVGRAYGLLTGDILAGEVVAPMRLRLGPRRFAYSFELVSSQRILRVRRRDELCWTDDPRLRVVVREIHRNGNMTRVSLEIIKGMVAIGLPRAGASLELMPEVPDWNRLMRTRVQLKERLSITPWTHTNNPMPQQRSRSAPRDPLAAVEALR